MNEDKTTALVRAFDRAYIKGKFVTPHGTQVVDLVNPTNNTVIGKVTMADDIDTRQAIVAAKEAFNTFSQSGKEYRMDCLQRLHDAVAKRMDQLVDATVLESSAHSFRPTTGQSRQLRSHEHFWRARRRQKAGS
jgi:aldehyde dehydrogenase (NAD+)